MNVPAKEAVNLMLAFAACGVVLNVYSAAISAFANPHANMLSSACKGSGDPVGNVLFCSALWFLVRNWGVGLRVAW